MEKLRVDKWLWSVRIFKTRTLAANNCKSGNIKINGEKAKPASSLSVDDSVSVYKNGFHLTFKAIKLISKRVGAPLAVECYENLTPDEELNKFSDWFIGKGRPEMRERGAGRPTKKERRVIDEFKEGFKGFED